MITEEKTSVACSQRHVEVRPTDLPLCCPPKASDVWNAHPRVYLQIHQGEALCPYCSTRYSLLTE